MRSQPDLPFNHLQDLFDLLDSHDISNFLIFSDFPLDLSDLLPKETFLNFTLGCQYFLCSPLDLSDLNFCDQCDTTKATSNMQQFGFCFIFVVF